MKVRKVRGTHRSCGPFVGALVLGITTDRAAKLIGRKRKRRQDAKVHAIRMQWLFDVFVDNGIRCRRSYWYDKGHEITAHRWMLTEMTKRKYRNAFIIVKTENHVMVVRNGRMIDNGDRCWRTHRDFARQTFGSRLDTRVLEWWVMATDRLPMRRFRS